MPPDPSPGAFSVRLPEILDVRAAGPLHAQLAAARGGPVAVDAGEVRRLGAQCLQVLLAADAAWRLDGLEFSIANRSEPFDQAVSLFGASFDDSLQGDALR